jgi:hypothetical protein
LAKEGFWWDRIGLGLRLNFTIPAGNKRIRFLSRLHIKDMRKEENVVSQFERATANLIEITRLKGGMLGKVDFQKTIYLAKQVGVYLPFEFKWDKLGPYSFELAHFLNQLLARGLFCVDRGTYLVNPEDVRVNRLEPLTTIDSRMRHRLISLFEAIRRTVHENGFHIPTFMECLGSLEFIKNSLEQAHKTHVFHALELLKPNRINEFSPMLEESWNLLEQSGL